MTDAEFGIWMMENLELLMPLEEELRKSGRLLPETSDLAKVHNASVLVDEFKDRYPERDPEVINATEDKRNMPVKTFATKKGEESSVQRASMRGEIDKDVQNAVKTFVKKGSPLAKCWICGEQTTKVARVRDVPPEIDPSGIVDLPYCDRHFAEFFGKGFKAALSGLTAFIGIGGGDEHVN